MATKKLHGKVMGYPGGETAMPYPTHLNGQGVSIFGPAHNSQSPDNYPQHENAQGFMIHGPARGNTVVTNYPHDKAIVGKGQGTTTIRAGSGGGTVAHRPFGGLKGASQK